MNEYRVAIQELMTHYLYLEAESPEEASKLAHEALSNQPEAVLKELYYYEAEGEYTGQHEAELW